MTTKLMKFNGGYITTDGRYTVTPKIMGDSPRNKGHREWRVTDLDSGSSKMVSTLTAARDFIGGLTK